MIHDSEGKRGSQVRAADLARVVAVFLVCGMSSTGLEVDAWAVGAWVTASVGCVGMARCAGCSLTTGCGSAMTGWMFGGGGRRGHRMIAVLTVSLSFVSDGNVSKIREGAGSARHQRPGTEEGCAPCGCAPP